MQFTYLYYDSKAIDKMGENMQFCSHFIISNNQAFTCIYVYLVTNPKGTF